MQAAAAERARLTGILERSLNEIYIFDAHTLRFEYVNEGALRNLGYTLEAMRVKTPLDLKPEFTEAKFLKMIKPLLADEKEKHVFHTIHRRADSSDYPVEVHLQMVAHSGKQVFLAVIQDITERKRAEQELANAQKQLVETSRMAGMAEVATSVLHNVGNVLNSVNVSASLVADKIKKSNSVHVRKVAALLREHESDLGAFLTSDAKGRQVPAFLATLGEAVALEQEQLLKEMAGLQKNIDHIKDVVAMQQSYAKVSAASETVKLDELIEECLRMNAGSLTKHDVRVVREFGETPAVEVDKHKLLQILLNLLSNAKQACDESGREDNQLTLRLACDGDRVRISVSDTGVGVAPENLNRVFNHGFTTKKDGHGFGLHSGANAAREMGGSLTVQSDGPGCGATFILELPVQPRQATQNLQP